jgi:hypothetical protein
MAGSKGYKVTNPTDRDIILNRFEGDDTYIVPAGKSITIDNQRAALTLKDAGAVLSQQTYERAAEDEARAEAIGRANEDGTPTRDQRRDRTTAGEPTVVNPSPVAPVGAQEDPLVPVVPSDEQVSDPHPSLTVPEELRDGDPVAVDVDAAQAKADADANAADDTELKGAALDEALEALSLPKTGTADEKRQRLAAANEAAATQDGKS